MERTSPAPRNPHRKRSGVYSRAKPPKGSCVKRSREMRWQSTEPWKKSSISSELERHRAGGRPRAGPELRDPGGEEGQKQCYRSRAPNWIPVLMRCWDPHNSDTQKALSLGSSQPYGSLCGDKQPQGLLGKNAPLPFPPQWHLQPSPLCPEYQVLPFPAPGARAETILHLPIIHNHQQRLSTSYGQRPRFNSSL